MLIYKSTLQTSLPLDFNLAMGKVYDPHISQSIFYIRFSQLQYIIDYISLHLYI